MILMVLVSNKLKYFLFINYLSKKRGALINEI